MARRRTVVAVAIRVALRPSRGQTANDYTQLLKDAFALKCMVHIHGNECMLLSTLHEQRDRLIPGTPRAATSIDGVISKFTEIDIRGDWFNSDTLKVATDKERKEIVIPPRLKPNYSAFFFEFFAEVHTFVVQTYGTGHSLSAATALRFISKLFEDLDLLKKWGPVSASLIQQHAALEQMLALKVLKKLTLIYVPPNADDHSKWEKHFEKKMEAEKLQKIEITHIAESGQSITPTEETKAQAAAALEIGSVLAKGRDANGAPRTIASENFPDAEPVKYDPDKQTEHQAFAKASGQLIARTRLAKRASDV